MKEQDWQESEGSRREKNTGCLQRETILGGRDERRVNRLVIFFPFITTLFVSSSVISLHLDLSVASFSYSPQTNFFPSSLLPRASLFFAPEFLPSVLPPHSNFLSGYPSPITIIISAPLSLYCSISVILLTLHLPPSVRPQGGCVAAFTPAESAAFLFDALISLSYITGLGLLPWPSPCVAQSAVPRPNHPCGSSHFPFFCVWRNKEKKSSTVVFPPCMHYARQPEKQRYARCVQTWGHTENKSI